jgi:hypothetical protein
MLLSVGARGQRAFGAVQRLGEVSVLPQVAEPPDTKNAGLPLKITRLAGEPALTNRA